MSAIDELIIDGQHVLAGRFGSKLFHVATGSGHNRLVFSKCGWAIDHLIGAA
jgi:hypothetical protein